MVTLVRQELPRSPVPQLDESQAAVLAMRAPVVRVLGAPGTGKSVLAAEIVARRVLAGEVRADACLVLAPTRRAAARLREAVTARTGATTSGPLARTPHSFAFAVLRRRAAALGEDAPRLITGPEQDAILRDLLDGYAAEPSLAPVWPAALAEAVGTRTFRGELRDLLMRALELGLAASGLRSAGEVHDRPEWVAAAQVLSDYEAVTSFASPGALDPAALLGAAAARVTEEPSLLTALRRDLRLVVVDDAQELTPAAVALLDVLVGGPGDGTPPGLVLLGDPDSAVQTFRGGEPGLFLDAWPRAPLASLGRGHRLGPALHEVAGRVTGHVGARGGGAHRRVEPAERAGRLEVHVFRTAAQEAAWVAERLRRRHLVDGVAWSELAVLARSRDALGTVERVLRSAGVPVAWELALPVRDHPAVRPFLTIASAVLRPLGAGPALAPDQVVELLRSPLGGADAVALRRLRRALRQEELSAGGGRPSSELLVEAVLDPARLTGLGSEAAALRRVARTVAAAVEAAGAPGASIETILWAMWSASGLAPLWQRAALAGGATGRRADGDLDAVVALFETAARHVERLPGQAPAGFVDHLLSQELVADSLAPRGRQTGAVSLLTPAEAAGQEWEEVCVVSVQEGQWPDPRLRGLLLGAPDLVDVARGRPLDRRAARAAVVHDETRLFHVALTRARSVVAVSAVRSEDTGPSAYLDVVDPAGGREGRIPTLVPRPLSLPGLVAEARRALAAPGDPGRRAGAAEALARLAAAGVPGADPSSWWGSLAVSDDRPRRPGDSLVRVSPSRLDRFARCPLQWFLTACGGQGPGLGASDIGTLVHAIAHDLGDVSASTYAAEVHARWGTLGLGSGWLAQRSLDQAVAMTGRLAEHVRSSSEAGWTREASEVPVDVVVGRARITGRVDRVERHGDGRVRIVDLKTGASKPSADELRRHRQLGAYQVALDHGALGDARVSGGAALLQLGRAATSRTSLQGQPPLAQDDDPQWAPDAVAADAELMAGASFAAAPGGGLCGTCQVASSCPARAEGRRLS